MENTPEISHNDVATKYNDLADLYAELSMIVRSLAKPEKKRKLQATSSDELRDELSIGTQPESP